MGHKHQHPTLHIISDIKKNANFVILIRVEQKKHIYIYIYLYQAFVEPSEKNTIFFGGFSVRPLDHCHPGGKPTFDGRDLPGRSGGGMFEGCYSTAPELVRMVGSGWGSLNPWISFKNGGFSQG